MAVFEDVVIQWDGRDYTVPEDRVMRLIAKIEDVVTQHELYEYAQRGTMPMGKLSMAYGAALRYAGANVRDDTIYKRILSGEREGNLVIEALNNLLQMMAVPDDLDVQEEKATSAKGTPGKSKAASKS